jgi:S-adenosylmethionine:tRNA-ribosyltransferase-isomerase (queuine synthetase)
MLTNFHRRASTLIMLVSAFAGRERDPQRHETPGERVAYSFNAMLIL